jgi:mannose-6-phosphate isomerase-like protein (cupin superfamily)
MLLMPGVLAFAQTAARNKPPTDQALIIGEDQLDSILKSAPISKETGKPGEVSQQLFSGDGFSTSFIRLEQADKPHIHPVNEIYIIKEGSATIVTGGTMLGPFTSGGVHHQSDKKTEGPPIDYSTAPDRGGSAIEGGKSQQVHAGSVVLVPAGVAHTWISVEKPIVYWDIKFPKQ